MRTKRLINTNTKQYRRIYQNRLLVLLALLFALLAPKIAFSLGLGEIKLHSYLNQPLSAEIELLSPEEVDLSQVLVSLASTEDFKKAQLARPYFLSRLRFEIVMHDDRTFIHVSTKENVKQAFLEFLIVLSWPDGRLVRGYTLLLDPTPMPEMAPQKIGENLVLDSEKDEKAFQYFSEKNKEKIKTKKSSRIAKNNYKNYLETEENRVDDEEAMSDREVIAANLKLKNFQNFENLFDNLKDSDKSTLDDTPIVRSKPTMIELSHPINTQNSINTGNIENSENTQNTQRAEITENTPNTQIVSSIQAKKTQKSTKKSGDIKRPETQSVDPITPIDSIVTSPETTSSETTSLSTKPYNRKHLWGSAFALLFVLALSAWIFRQTRDPLQIFSEESLGNIPLAKSLSETIGIKTEKTEEPGIFDDEMQIKLLLAKQYFMINDHVSAEEILDDVLSRGSSEAQEEAQKLRKKNHAL